VLFAVAGVAEVDGAFEVAAGAVLRAAERRLDEWRDSNGCWSVERAWRNVCGALSALAGKEPRLNKLPIAKTGTNNHIRDSFIKDHPPNDDIGAVRLSKERRNSHLLTHKPHRSLLRTENYSRNLACTVDARSSIPDSQL
jgi:hypothetical protein